MPTYDDVTVELIGQDGNAFNLIGLTARAIRKGVGADAATAFTARAMEQASYDALLRYIQDTVHVS